MLNPSARKRVLNPEKELRFTRSRQALGFAILAAVLITAAIIIGVTGWVAHRSGWPPPLSPYWAILPLILAIPVAWAAAFLATHAYLLLTPLGIEIFPFWRPAANFRIIHWAEIGNLTIDEEQKLLVIDFKESTGGVVLTLSPLGEQALNLLRRALEGRTK